MSDPEVISTGDAFIQFDMLKAGTDGYLRLSTVNVGVTIRLERDEAIRLRDALDRRLKATGESLAAAVERERRDG